MGTRSNRAAIGARVRVDVSGPDGPRSVHRVIGGGSSFGNNPLTPTIGLGQAEAITALEIRWPDGGTRQVVRNVPLDRAIEIIEGREGYRLLELGSTHASRTLAPDEAEVNAWLVTISMVLHSREDGIGALACVQIPCRAECLSPGERTQLGAPAS